MGSGRGKGRGSGECSKARGVSCLMSSFAHCTPVSCPRLFTFRTSRSHTFEREKKKERDGERRKKCRHPTPKSCQKQGPSRVTQVWWPLALKSGFETMSSGVRPALRQQQDPRTKQSTQEFLAHTKYVSGFSMDGHRAKKMRCLDAKQA